MESSITIINIKKEIDKYLLDNNKKIHRVIDYLTDYSLTESGEYMVTCTLKESGNTVLQTKINVPKEEDAIKMCENWEKNADEVYALLIVKMLAD